MMSEYPNVEIIQQMKAFVTDCLQFLSLEPEHKQPTSKIVKDDRSTSINMRRSYVAWCLLNNQTDYYTNHINNARFRIIFKEACGKLPGISLEESYQGYKYIKIRQPDPILKCIYRPRTEHEQREIKLIASIKNKYSNIEHKTSSIVITRMTFGILDLMSKSAERLIDIAFQTTYAKILETRLLSNRHDIVMTMMINLNYGCSLSKYATDNYLSAIEGLPLTDTALDLLILITYRHLIKIEEVYKQYTETKDPRLKELEEKEKEALEVLDEGKRAARETRAEIRNILEGHKKKLLVKLADLARDKTTMNLLDLKIKYNIPDKEADEEKTIDLICHLFYPNLTRRPMVLPKVTVGEKQYYQLKAITDIDELFNSSNSLYARLYRLRLPKEKKIDITLDPNLTYTITHRDDFKHESNTTETKWYASMNTRGRFVEVGDILQSICHEAKNCREDHSLLFGVPNLSIPRPTPILKIVPTVSKTPEEKVKIIKLVLPKKVVDVSPTVTIKEVTDVKTSNPIGSRKQILASTRRYIWNQQFEPSIGMCFCCHQIVDRDEYQCGHVISVKNGGDNSLDNLRPICGPCNRSMKAMNMDEFIQINSYPGKL